MKPKLFNNLTCPRIAILLTIGLFFYSTFLMAQVSVSGSVIAKKDSMPLPGANVFIKGTNTGTLTDFDGNFSIQATSGDILVISYIGYLTKEIKIAEETIFQVLLEENPEALDEIVVIGYGSKSKRKLISAVSIVDEETLKKIPVPTVSNALEGLAPGLFVRQGSGEPGFSESSFEIRNFGNALVIVDGAPGNLNQLDPNEIESISVLKDAAAAAVYGVQGGNGVILIETKKGSFGKPKLNYSNQFTYTSFTSYPDYLNSHQYAQILNEGLVNSNQNPFYSEEEIEAFRTGSDPIICDIKNSGTVLIERPALDTPIKFVGIEMFM